MKMFKFFENKYINKILQQGNQFKRGHIQNQVTWNTPCIRIYPALSVVLQAVIIWQ